MLCGVYDPSSLTGDGTHTPFIGGVESQPWDHQGSVCFLFWGAFSNET